MYLIHFPGSLPTGERLAGDLGISHGRFSPDGREDILVRWGSVRRVRFRPGRVINPLNALERSSDKLEMLRAFDTVRVPVPEWQEEAPRFSRSDRGPWIARTRRHAAGSGFHLCLQQRDIEAAAMAGISDYFIRYIPTIREFRVHVFMGRALCVVEKVATGENPHPHLRNYGGGWTFHFRDSADPELENVGIRAVEAVGLDFGGVDIVQADWGGYLVLETNAAPGLDPECMAYRKYLQAFRAELGLGLG